MERELLRRLIDENGADMAFVSQKVAGRNHSYLHQYFKKGSPRRLPEDARNAIEDFFKKPRGFLSGEYAQTPVAARQGLMEGVPVYGYASGAASTLAINDGAIVGYIPERVPGMGGDGFYLIVEGDSMEPALEQGDKLAVSRVMPPKKGRYCVVEFIDGSAVVKRFISKTDKKFICEQLNPPKALEFDMKEITAIYAVVGQAF